MLSKQQIVANILNEHAGDAERFLTDLGYTHVEARKNDDYTWTVSYTTPEGVNDSITLKGSDLI